MTLLAVLSNSFGLMSGAALTLLSVCLVVVFWRRRQAKKQIQKLKAQKEKAERALAAHEKEGKRLFQEGKYQLAEFHFNAAAENSRSLGNTRRCLQNKHHALIARSRQGSDMLVAAIKQLGKLTQEMRQVLPARDKLVLLAESNLQKLKAHGLKQSAQNDFKNAGRLYDAGKHTEARRHYEAAYRAARHLKDEHLCALVLNDLSRVHAHDGKLDEAKRLLHQARQLALETSPQGQELLATIDWNLAYYQSQQDESEVQNLLGQVKRAYKAHDYHKAGELADDCLKKSVAVLKIDHWLSADALHHRACIKMAQGFYSEARNDFDSALAILSEWPEKGAQLSELIQNNLERCRRDMGY